MRSFSYPIELEPWLERTECTGADAERVRVRCSPTGSPTATSTFERIALRGKPLADGDPRRRGDAPRRPGPHRQRGPLPRPAQPRVRDERRRGRHARARAARTSRGSRCSTPSPRRSPRRAPNTSLDLRPGSLRRRRGVRGGRRRHRHRRLHHRAHPGARHAQARARTSRARGATMIGPNCPGVLSPGQGERRDHPGRGVRGRPRSGLVSRSGTLTYQIGYELAQLGLGNSTIVGIGGDPVVGSTFIDMLERFEADPETELVVLVGEIGGDEEEKAARHICRADDRARRRLHRGLLGAAGQDDGPCRRDHLGLLRHGAGEEGGARGGRHRRRHDADRGRADRLVAER